MFNYIILKIQMSMLWCKIKDKIQPIINDWDFKIIFLYLAVILLLIFFAYRIYNTYIYPRLNPDFVPNKEFEVKKKSNEAEFLFFCVKWCPHCNAARPEWTKVKAKFQNKKINGIKVFFRQVDCDEEGEIAEEYKVENYPTLKLIKGDEIIEFNAKPEADILEEFLQTVL